MNFVQPETECYICKATGKSWNGVGTGMVMHFRKYEDRYYSVCPGCLTPFNLIMEMKKERGGDIRDAMNDVRDFHEKFDIDRNDSPTTQVDPETKELRKKLVREESEELIEAIESGDLSKILHEGIDVIYVVIGTFVTYGLLKCFGPAWRLIHLANMKKEKDAKRKVRKPVGFVNPDVSPIVAKEIEIVQENGYKLQG